MKGIKLFTLFLFSLWCCGAFAQSITVNGKVTSDGEPVVGAYVLVEGTTNGQLTDLDGSFTLINVPSGSNLVVAFMGMKTQEVAAAP